MIRGSDNAHLGTAVRLAVVLLCGAFCSLLLSLPGHAAESRTRLTAAVLADFPPLYVTDGEGRPDGFALDILKAVAADAGIDYDLLVVRNWAEAMDAVKKKRADFVPGIGVSPSREEEFLFTDVFETIPISCFVRSDTFDVHSVDGLVGRRTAVIHRSAAFTYLSGIPGMHFAEFDSIDEALFSLLSGKVDGFVCPEPVLLKKAREIGVEGMIKVVGKPLMELRRGYLLRRTEARLVERFNASINKLPATPQFADVYMKWWGEPTPFWTLSNILIGVGLVLLVAVVGLMVWHYQSVMALNKDLEETAQDRLRIQTRLQTSEQRLNKSQEVASFGSFERNLEDGKGYWSESLCKLFGIVPRPEAPSFEEFMLMLHPDDRMIYIRSNEAMSVANPNSRFEFRFRHGQTGEYRYALCSQMHEFDANGVAVFRIGAIQDITERKRMDAELLKAKHTAEAASRSKSEFLANMSHELRTPLNGALGMLQLLSMDDLNSEQREYVQTAITSCRNLTDLLGDILDLSRVEAGKLELYLKEFEPGSIIDSVRNTFSQLAAQKGVEFVFTSDPTLPHCVVGDPARLRQVLFNLVGNALKFTDKGAVSVEITHYCGRTERDCRLLFTVSDTGIGIPDDMIGRIFGAFTQVDGAYSRRFQGAGLGLHIVKRLADLMGGNLSIESELDRGTTIYFAAPFSLAEDRGDNACGAEIHIPSSGLSPKRVLIAEDDRVNQLAIRKFVEKLGHVAEVVGNGEEALAKLARSDFDILLLDIQMPVMNGIEAARRIRTSEHLGVKQGIPIVALTAHAMTGDRERFLDKGMNDYLAKPVDIAELRLVLERNLG